MKLTSLIIIGLILTILGSAPTAGAANVQLSGEQTLVDADLGIFSMSGSLVGDWYTTSFQCHPTPAGERWPCTGTELFVGCLDSSGDGTCAQETAGWLAFEFEYTATPVGNGRCHHAIVDGGRAFKGASGVITMKDRPTASGIVTTYRGHVDL
jgi:hypothetical protein